MPITGHGTGEGNFRRQRKNSVLPCKDARIGEYLDHYVSKVLSVLFRYLSMFTLLKKEKNRKIDLSVFLSWEINPEIGPAMPLGDILGVIPRVEFPAYVYY